MRISRSTSVGISFANLLALLATPAYAQATAEPNMNNAAGLDEIVVTAQHREERLQDVPIAISTVSAGNLANAGISATNAISQLIPAVQVTRSGSSGLFFVRGVGSTNAAGGEEGTNAFYVDGVYIADLQQTITNFNSVKRIEVLKGPQGTLFGRNATGGLIHIVTRDPGDLTEVEGKIGYSNYDTVSGQIYAATPITDNLAGDIALTYQNQGKGWGRNLTRNEEVMFDDYWGVRSKAALSVGERAKLVLAGEYFVNKDTTGVARRIDTSLPGVGGYISPGGYDTTANDPALAQVKIWGVSLRGEIELGFANLTSVTAVRDSVNTSTIDIDGGPLGLRLDYRSSSRSYQQELRLASASTDPLAWQLGLFYLNLKAAAATTMLGFGLDSLTDGSVDTDSYAAFGELTYHLTPTTVVTGGLRYTVDQRRFTGQVTPLTGGSPGTSVEYPRAGIDAFDPTLKQGSMTYRLALRQDLTEDINVYASINRGFKSGGFSLTNLANPPYKPQYIMAYEIGFKSELFDRKLRLNVSAFHYDISDYQVRNVVNGQTFFRNAGAVKVDGIDLEFEAAPTTDLRIFGGASILNSRFSDFRGAPFIYPNPATCAVPHPGAAGPGVVPGGTNPGATPTGGLTTCFGDASGNKTMLAPKFTASLGATYTIDLSGGRKLRLSGLYSHNSGYYFEVDEYLKEDSFDLLNASIGFSPSELWGIELWAKNITNTEYYAGRQGAGTGTTAVLAAPRTYGASLNFNF